MPVRNFGGALLDSPDLERHTTLLNGRQCCGRARNGSPESFRNRDIVAGQSLSHGRVELYSRTAISAEGGNFRGLGSGEIALNENHVKDGGGAEGIFLLLGVQGLLAKDTGLGGGKI